MTLDEIRDRHTEMQKAYDAANRMAGITSPATGSIYHKDRAQLLAWLDAALPFVEGFAEMSGRASLETVTARKLLAQMGVKP